MKKILVVFTGGTIGSTAVDGTIDTSSGTAFKLLQLFQAHDADPASVHFDTLQPLQILSENLAPPAWTVIIEAIEAAQPESYDGIIVTHGTDTLAYTANALGFYFHALTKPILLVSSDYPLDNPKANGLAHFCCAVEFIRQDIAHGVFVPYRNAGQALQIHQGTRLTCSLQLTGDFMSVQDKSFMQFDGNCFSVSERTVKQLDKSQAKPSKANGRILLKPAFSSRILMIKPYPGLDYRHFSLQAVDAVLHDLYHSGTACATVQWGDEHSLVEFLRRCLEQEVPVYLAPAYKSENAYQSTRQLIEQGAVMIWNMSIEAAYVKLTLAYGNFTESVQRDRFIAMEVADEVV